MADAGSIRNVACVGSGLIGAGWTTRFLRAGLDVACHDVRPEAEDYLRTYVERAWESVSGLGVAESASPANLRFSTDLRAALAGAHFVQESSIEDEAKKIEILAAVDARVADRDVVIASSSSGFLAARLRSRCRNPGRVIIGHPFNPPYLIPLVQVVAGEGSDRDAVSGATAFYSSIGSRPIVVEKEIAGSIANRLQSTVFREVLHIHGEGVASVRDIDDAMRFGPGLRWACIGPSEVSFLGARDPTKYPEFLELLVSELPAGYVAPVAFEPSSEGVGAYRDEVRALLPSADVERLCREGDDNVLAARGAIPNQRSEA